MVDVQGDLQKAKAAGQAALEDVNKAASWIERNPRLGAAALFVVGFLVGAAVVAIHLHK